MRTRLNDGCHCGNQAGKEGKIRGYIWGQLYIGPDMYADNKFYSYLTISIETLGLIQETSGDALLVITFNLH